MSKCVVAVTALLMAAVAFPAAAAGADVAKKGGADQAAQQQMTKEMTQKMAKCKYPEPPKVPDGATASEAAMGQAGAQVRDYVAGVQSSLQCLSEVEKSMGDDITDDQEATIVAVYNNGVDQMNAIAQEYNKQVRAFKSR